MFLTKKNNISCETLFFKANAMHVPDFGILSPDPHIFPTRKQIAGGYLLCTFVLWYHKYGSTLGRWVRRNRFTAWPCVSVTGGSPVVSPFPFASWCEFQQARYGQPICQQSWVAPRRSSSQCLIHVYPLSNTPRSSASPPIIDIDPNRLLLLYGIFFSTQINCFRGILKTKIPKTKRKVSGAVNLSNAYSNIIQTGTFRNAFV